LCQGCKGWRLALGRKTAYMGPMDVLRFEAPADGRPRLPPRRQTGPAAPHGPLLNAPWPAVAIAAAMVVGYAVQSRYPLDAVALSYAFSPAQLAQGDYGRLVSYMFVHGGWPHALMNAAFGLAFATPVARFFGERPTEVALFFLFYVTCGVLAALGYSAVHPGAQGALVGASGAVSGLMGGAARIIGGRGGLGRTFSRPVLSMGAAWLIINLILGVVGGGLTPGSGGAAVAWEAHIAGFLAGVLAISPFAWAARRA